MTCPPLRIQVRPPGDTPARVLEVPGPSVVIGRGRAAQVRLPGADVSAAHARLQWSADALRAEDLGSENGTRMGEQQLLPGRTYALGWGEPLHIADYVLTVLDPDASAPAELMGEEGTATLAAHLLRDLAGDREAARLRVRDPAGQERIVGLVPGERFRMGRDAGCQVQLDDPDLSREHAELRMAATGATLRDLASKNGISVNGEPWTTGSLRHGDVIRLGGCEAWYEDPAEALLEELDHASQEPPPDQDEDADPPPPPAELPLESKVSEGGLQTPDKKQEDAAPGGLHWVLVGIGLVLMGTAAYLMVILFL